MRVTPQGAGRLDGIRYFALKLSGVETLFEPTAAFFYDGLSLPCPLWCVEGAGTRTQTWVLAFPFFPDKQQGIDLFDEKGALLFSKRFSTRAFNLYNSVTCRVKPRLTSQMHGLEATHADELAQISILGVFPFDDESEVTRVDLAYPEGVSNVEVDPLQVIINGSPLDAQVLRCGIGDDRRHHIVLSYRLRKDEGDIFFGTPSGKGFNPCVFHMLPDLRSSLVHASARFLCDAANDPEYAAWFMAQRATEVTLAQQRTHHFAHEPLVSIVVPIYLVPLNFLKECVESVLAQSYQNWELLAVDTSADEDETRGYLRDLAAQDGRVRVIPLLENLGIVGNTNVGVNAARGEYVAFLDQDDLLEPDALFEYVRYINDHPEAGLIYCDEDSLVEKDGPCFSPRFKPDFNRDALYSHNYVIHMLMLKKSVLDEIGLSPAAMEGAQDYDLTLRASEVAPLGHVPRVLYHWRRHELSTNSGNSAAKPYAIEAGVRALQAHFSRRNLSVTVKPARSPYTYRVNYLTDEECLVSVIIPTKDHPELLGPCVDSLLAHSGWRNLEILLVENNSADPATFAFYDELVAKDSRIRILRYEGTFNYSKIINFAAREAKGSLLYLLNNDTITRGEGLIRTLAEYFQRPEVGVVGPLLFFPDGLVQTAGLALMADKRLGFINQNLTLDTHGGYLASLECPRNYSAVLGAAQMVRADLFHSLGGYDENLAVTYNDVDFCWRVREAGKLIVYTPHAQMIHREFATRGRDAATPERAAQTLREAEYMRDRWPEHFSHGDPELNPECDQSSPWFKLASASAGAEQ